MATAPSRFESARQPTIVDVARLSGVSKSTVANVVRGTVPVAEETRARVELAIKELGYRPNALARDLKRSRTATVGVMVGDLANSFYAELTKLVEQRTTRAGIATLICDATGGGVNDERAAMGLLLEHRVSGVLLMFYGGDAGIVEDAERAGVPIVGLSVVDRRFDSVAADDAKGARLAAEHLASLGHQRIAYVPSAATEASTNEARLRGWRSTLRRLGLNPKRQVALSATHGRRGESLEAMLARPDAPTGFFAANDVTALQLIDRLELAGVSVPDEASVVGFDDIAAGRLGRVGLTTLRQPIEQLAERAVEQLLGRVSGNTTPANVQRFAPELIVRRTTAPPAR